jgi:hypothetical protein
MQLDTKQKIAREALIWCQYFVISSLSVVWAHDRYLSERYSLPVAVVDAIPSGVSYPKEIKRNDIFLGIVLLRHS